MSYPSFLLGIVLSAPVVALSPKPVQVHGVVTDEAGKPLDGVTWRTSGIEEWRDGRWKLAFFTPPAQEHTTADDGRFTLEFPTTCRFDLQFDKWGYGPVFVYQVGPDSPEIQVKMRKGVLVQGRVRRTDKHVFDLGPTMVAVKLPNRRGVWYQKTTPVDHEGKFRFYVCPPPLPPDDDVAPKWPPVPPRPDRPILWQIVCAGEVVQIDVEEGKPIDEVIFELTVTAKAARRFVHNLKNMRPSELLSHLRALETGTCTVTEVRGAWVEERDLPGLFKLLDSEEKCASVVNAVWSPHVDMGKPTTVGREAGFLIKSFRTQQYPAPLGSTMSDADKQELREWWRKNRERRD
jgi:hypothetical protein